MSAGIIIALDVMGGDQAPRMVLKGADKALTRYPSAQFQLYGDEQKIKPLLAKMPRLARCATIHHTDEVVTNEAKPSIALRSGRRSSMRLAIKSASSVYVSAGLGTIGIPVRLGARAEVTLHTLCAS